MQNTDYCIFFCANVFFLVGGEHCHLMLTRLGFFHRLMGREGALLALKVTKRWVCGQDTSHIISFSCWPDCKIEDNSVIIRNIRLDHHE